jgi:hypothetical protein
MSDPEGTRRSPPEPTVPSGPALVAGRRRAAISDRHLSLLAIVYVRQSGTQQIFDRQESRERQYALSRTGKVFSQDGLQPEVTGIHA